MAELCKPDSIHWCDGSQEEFYRVAEVLMQNGTCKRAKRENCYYCQSEPSDVARVEDRTFICTKSNEEAGPTNNWMNPGDETTLRTFLTDV